MNIALVAPIIFPVPSPAYGGVEAVLANLAARLCDLGHTVTLYAKKGSKPDPRARVVEIEAEADAFTEDLLAADVVHMHGWDAPAFWAFAEANPDRRFVQTWHGPSMGYTAPPANVTVCGVSHWHAWSMSAELGVECVGVPNGIHLADYPLYEGPRERFLLSLNRLDPAKGIHRAIAVAKTADMQLRIAGPEHGVPDPGYVQAILSRCDGERVVYEGNLGLEDKVHLLQRATAVLWLGGWEEPFGLGIVEANACGTPVLALARGALPEVLRGGGKALLEIDHKEDAGRFLALPSFYCRPLECRANAERFTDTIMAQRYEEVYARAAQ